MTLSRMAELVASQRAVDYEARHGSRHMAIQSRPFHQELKGSLRAILQEADTRIHGALCHSGPGAGGCCSQQPCQWRATWVALLAFCRRRKLLKSKRRCDGLFA